MDASFDELWATLKDKMYHHVKNSDTFFMLSRLELVSTNDVAVFRSCDGTLSDEVASVELKHQNLLKIVNIMLWN